MKRIVIFFALWLILSADKGFCNQNNTSDNLTELSLEELMNVEVTLAAKKPQKLSQSAAAVFVITGEDIRRLGCTSIPDALRMVPGLQVAQLIQAGGQLLQEGLTADMRISCWFLWTGVLFIHLSFQEYSGMHRIL